MASKKSKILASMLAVSTMAVFYAAPVMAGKSDAEPTAGTGITINVETDGTPGTPGNEGLYVYNVGGNTEAAYKVGGTLNISTDDITTALQGANLTLDNLTTNTITTVDGTTIDLSQFADFADVDLSNVKNVKGIKRYNANSPYGDGRTEIEGVVGVNGKNGRFYVLGEDGRTQAAVITNDGTARFGDYNNANVRMENGVLSINSEGTNAVASLSKDGLMLSDSENVQQTLTAAKIADIQHIEHVGNATVIEQNTAISADGIVVRDPGSGVSTKTKYDGFYVKDKNSKIVSSLKDDGLMLTDQESGETHTLNATDIADIKGIDRVDTNNDGTLDTTVIEKTLAVSETGIAMSKGDMQLAVNEAGFAAVKGDNAINLNESGVKLSAGNDNFVSVTQNGIGLQGGTSQVIMNSNNGAVFRNGDKAVNGETVINGGMLTASNDIATTNANGSTKYTLNTVGADLDALETNVGNISGNVAGIKRDDANLLYGDGRTEIEGVVGVNGKNGRFYVLGEDGRTQAAVITNDGTARFGDYNNANVRMENGVLSINSEGTNAVASLSKDGLMLSDSENVQQTLTAAKIADIQHIEHVDNATVIEGATSFTTNGMETNRITATSGNIGGVEIAGGLVDGVNMDDLGGIKRTGTGEPGTQTTTIEGVTSFNSDGMTTTTVTTSEIGVGGSGFYANSTGITVGNGRFSVDSGTGNLAISNGTVPVFQVNGKTGQVNIGANGGSQTVITGNSITTETLNVEKIVLGDKIVDKETGNVIGGELEIGADGSIKIDNAGTEDVVEFNATKTALSANYGGTSLNMNSNGFNLNNGTGAEAESFVLNADGFAFKGSLNLGAGSDVKYTGGNYGTLAKLDATVKDIYDRTDGIYKDSEGNTVISNEPGSWNGTKTEYTGEGSKVVVGANGTTFENGAGNGTTNIDGSKITSDADGTISGGSGPSTNNIRDPFGSSTSNGEETVYDGENGNTNIVNSSGMTVTTETNGENDNTNTVNSSGMTVTNGTSTTVIGAEKVDTTTGNFSDKVTVGSEGNQTVITGGNVTVDNSVTVGSGENQTIVNNDGVTVGGADGTSINHDEVRVGGKGGSYMNDTDVVSGEGVSLNQTAERVGHLENRVGKLEDRIDKVGAMAAAIANLRTMGYDPAAPTEVAVGIGQYRDETGAALGLFHYPNRDFMLSLSVSTSGDEVMGGIGATWKFGRKSPEKVAEIKKAQAEADARRAEEAKLAKAEEMKQAAKEAKIKAQQERHAKLAAERAAQAEAAK